MTYRPILVGTKIRTNDSTFHVVSVLGPVINVTCSNRRGWRGKLDLAEVHEKVKAGEYSVENGST